MKKKISIFLLIAGIFFSENSKGMCQFRCTAKLGAMIGKLTKAQHDQSSTIYKKPLDLFKKCWQECSPNRTKNFKRAFVQNATDYSVCHILKWQDYCEIKPLLVMGKGCIGESSQECALATKQLVHKLEPLKSEGDILAKVPGVQAFINQKFDAIEEKLAEETTRHVVTDQNDRQHKHASAIANIKNMLQIKTIGSFIETLMQALNEKGTATLANDVSSLEIRHFRLEVYYGILNILMEQGKIPYSF